MALGLINASFARHGNYPRRRRNEAPPIFRVMQFIQGVSAKVGNREYVEQVKVSSDKIFFYNASLDISRYLSLKLKFKKQILK